MPQWSASAAQDPDKKNCSHEEQLYHRMKYLLLGSRLSRAFAMLLDALNYHRGKGQQHILVEHVHVNSGGQAAVGNVGITRGDRGERRSTGDRSQIPKRKGVGIFYVIFLYIPATVATIATVLVNRLTVKDFLPSYSHSHVCDTLRRSCDGFFTKSRFVSTLSQPTIATTIVSSAL